jgi:hypothetical protein
MVQVEIIDFVRLFGGGLACGIVLSLLPFVVGEIINFAFRVMKS